MVKNWSDEDICYGWRSYPESRVTLEKLRDPRFSSGNLQFRLTESDLLYIQFQRASCTSDSLIIHFHGAVERTKRPLPTFQPNVRALADAAHQLSICDPTMTSREGFSLAWYIGHENLPVQLILRDLFDLIKKALGIKRTVYCGSSGGGFASLYYSFFDSNSAAVVMVPQTNISRHGPNGWLEKTYLARCWSRRPLEEVSRVACINVCDLYSQGFNNFIVYLQSAGDFVHSTLHMTAFLNAIHEADGFRSEKFILHSHYWGRLGHSKVIPFETYSAWIRTIFAAPTLVTTDVLKTYNTLTERGNIISAPAGLSTYKPLASDLRLADLLRDYHLRRSVEI
jgi:hypothetical protein